MPNMTFSSLILSTDHETRITCYLELTQGFKDYQEMHKELDVIHSYSQWQTLSRLKIAKETQSNITYASTLTKEQKFKWNR